MRARIARVWLLAALAAAAIGCASRVVQPTAARPPLDPAKVALYPEQPLQYEDWGMVEVSEGVKYGEDFAADAVVDALKAKAAAKGANGLLLTPVVGPNYVTVGAFYRDRFYHFPVRTGEPRTAFAKAIYVLKE